MTDWLTSRLIFATHGYIESGFKQGAAAKTPSPMAM